MEQQKIEQLINKLSIDKRKEIATLLSDACMSINSVDCLLLDTDLRHHSLFDGEHHATLWCQVYDLHKKFLIL